MQLPDEAATLAFAADFAHALLARASAERTPPWLDCSVALVGGLGAGKTTFVRGVLRALGVVGPIKSPTYALVESYDTAAGPVHHLDAYRIDGRADFESRGGFEYFDAPALRLVEWPEMLNGAIQFDIEVRIDYAGEWRQVTVTPGPKTVWDAA
ncbi:MAG: tRNA (adenosine(37)-N6)-threonylcarbamoyltransferase complex ATPase subunit type 1 TsaE [Burkholderiales bacterium]|nr:tRNA (adenosine(37)-N6)-threonylcarbamoyltransferase complex ATPase subunit type 1 TsaE [Burkholderiales bacterium]